MKNRRSGSVIKWIAIVLGVLLVAAAGAFFYVRHRLTKGSEKPLEIPDVVSDSKVQFSLKRNVEQHSYMAGPPSPGASAPPATPGSVSLTGEELTLLVAKLLPPIPGMKMLVEINDGKADLKLSLPTKELMKVVKDELGSVGDYIENNLQWVNVNAQATLRLADGKLEIAVKAVRQPDFISPKQLQQIVDNALKQRPPGPIVVPLDGMPFQVLELDLDGNVAITKVARLPAGSDAKR